MHDIDQGMTPPVVRATKRLQRWKHISTAIAIFVLGIIFLAASIVVENDHRSLSEFLSALAAVTMAAIAIPYLYEWFLKEDEARIVMNEFTEVLDSRLKHLSLEPTRLRIRESGRLPVEAKLEIMKCAVKEIVQIGISVRALVTYFESKPSSDFRQPIIGLLERGVTMTVLLLNPDSDLARAYSQCRGEPELLDNIRRSVRSLLRLREEFAGLGLRGELRVMLYEEHPYADILMIDRSENNARANVAPYLNIPGKGKAENPTFEVFRNSNAALFAHLKSVVDHLITVSRAPSHELEEG